MKKYRLLTMLMAVLLAASVFTGCGAVRALDRAEDHVENRLDQLEDALEKVPQNSTSAAAKTLTREEAEAIALQHAGLTAADIAGLHSEYDVDDGVPEWEIDFYSGGWEYEYTVHAQSGAILHSEKEIRD